MWRRLVLIVAPAVAGLLAWEFAVWLEPRYGFFLGSPVGIWEEALRLSEDAALFRHAVITGTEALVGFFLGTILGTTLGLTFWRSRILLLVSKPYLMALGAVPVFALGPVLIFWFGTGIWSKIVLAFLSTFVIAVMQAFNGAAEADRTLQSVIRAFGGSDGEVFVRVIVPSSAVWVLSGVRLNIGMALLGAFVGEFISSRAGLGHIIIVGEGLYNVDQIWVGLFGIMIIALIFQACAMPAERWARRWQ